MATKVHHPVPEVRDQTGLVICGRHADGRYQYRSVSVLDHRNVVALTHEQRVGLALCYAIAQGMRPGRKTTVYPMTRDQRTQGYGGYNSTEFWITRSQLGQLGKAYLDGHEPSLGKARGYASAGAASSGEGLRVGAHEMGHNTQMGGRPHGRQFDEAHARMRVAMKKVLYKGWPKLDMRKLRDSVAPHLVKLAAKKARKSVAASESRVVKWTRTFAQAEKKLLLWEKALIYAERKVAAWQKKVRHAQRFLDKATQEEG